MRSWCWLKPLRSLERQGDLRENDRRIWAQRIWMFESEIYSAMLSKYLKSAAMMDCSVDWLGFIRPWLSCVLRPAWMVVEQLTKKRCPLPTVQQQLSYSQIWQAGTMRRWVSSSGWSSAADLADGCAGFIRAMGDLLPWVSSLIPQFDSDDAWKAFAWPLLS